MAVWPYSPSTLPIVRDLYSVSFSDGNIVGTTKVDALFFGKWGSLKDRAAMRWIEIAADPKGLLGHKNGDVRGLNSDWMS